MVDFPLSFVHFRRVWAIKMSSGPSALRTSDFPIVKIHRWWFKNPARKPVELSSLSHCATIYERFIHPRWCRIAEPSTVSYLFMSFHIEQVVCRIFKPSTAIITFTQKKHACVCSTESGDQIFGASKLWKVKWAVHLVVWIILGMKKQANSLANLCWYTPNSPFQFNGLLMIFLTKNDQPLAGDPKFCLDYFGIKSLCYWVTSPFPVIGKNGFFMNFQ